MGNPTNSDIYRALGKLDEKVDQIHDQVKRTNGRVNKLDAWKERVEAVESYKESKFIPVVTTKEGWTSREKTLTAMITALLAIVGALVGTGKI